MPSNRLPREKSKNVLNRIPLWMQLALFTALITFTVLAYLIYTDYQRYLSVITNTRTDTSSHLLSMEVQELEKYVQELSLFCVQSCYDPAFSNIVEKDSAILPDEETYLKNQIRAYYYSRNDLKNLDFYLFNHSRRFTRTQDGIWSQAFSVAEAEQTPYYQECLVNPYFHAILPSEEPGVLFHYYHSLLRIKTRQPQAMIHIAVDERLWNSFSANHNVPGEFICLLDKDGQLLHSSNTDLISSGENIPQEAYGLASGSTLRCSLGGQQYLVTCADGSVYRMRLLAFMPVSYIDAQIAQARHSILASGLLISVVVLVLITVLIRLLTNPLITLSNKLVNVGKGDFTSHANISGSYEIFRLSSSFDEMIDHIDHLIKKNYVAELNEKTARIMALEAQINPHFLYNTLQAISTEALVNDQEQIYDMITALASGLRYTIKGGDCVPLCQELEYAKAYVKLQKIRMNERLLVDFHIQEQTLECMVPKISIQALVENSILHGMGPQRDSISIEVSSVLMDDYLHITIRDNGCGIDAQQLAAIRKSFEERTLSSTNNSIGLANLHSRLCLLYQNRAQLKIESCPDSYTVISLIIPATKETPHV